MNTSVEMNVGCLPGEVLDAPEILGLHASDSPPTTWSGMYWLRHGGWSSSELLRAEVIRSVPHAIDPSHEWSVDSRAPAGTYCFQFMDQIEGRSVEEAPPAVLVMTLLVSMYKKQGYYPVIPPGAEILCKEKHPQQGDVRFSIRDRTKHGDPNLQPFQPAWVGMGRKGIWLRHWRVS